MGKDFVIAKIKRKPAGPNRIKLYEAQLGAEGAKAKLEREAAFFTVRLLPKPEFDRLVKLHPDIVSEAN